MMLADLPNFITYPIVEVPNGKTKQKTTNFTIKLIYCLNTGLKITSANWTVPAQHRCPCETKCRGSYSPLSAIVSQTQSHR